MKVLVVEDERWARKDLVRAIQQLADSLPSFSVREAANGEEAWKLIVSETPDLLITDIRMPKMDGLELIAKAKAQNPLLLCMIVSGYDEFEYARQGIKYGVKQYLLKPVQEAELASALAEAAADLQARKRTEREESRHSLYRWLVSPASSPAPELRELRGPIAVLVIQAGNRRSSSEGTALSGQPGFAETDAADCICCTPPDQSNLLVLIRPLPSVGSSQETKRLMMAWAQEWLDRLPLPMAHAAYEQVESAAQLPDAYRRMTVRMHHALQLEKKQIIHPEHQPTPPPDLHEIWSLVRVVGHAVQNGLICACSA